MRKRTKINKKEAGIGPFLKRPCKKFKLKFIDGGSGGGSVGRAVASDPEVRGSNPIISKNLC